ncbi:hypothetical protein KAS79_03435 [Candidatus Parcubacteria bacterium]|nr:hypothetical protein [Candidatus Parcubacteria bacterium]
MDDNERMGGIDGTIEIDGLIEGAKTSCRERDFNKAQICLNEAREKTEGLPDCMKKEMDKKIASVSSGVTLASKYENEI